MTRAALWFWGGWLRPCPPMGEMYFLFRRSADRYRSTMLGAIDPYARHMGAAHFVPGRVFRRCPR